MVWIEAIAPTRTAQDGVQRSNYCFIIAICEAINKLIHEVNQDFAFNPREKGLDLVKRIAGPSGRVDEDQSKRDPDKRLNFTYSIFKLSVVGFDLKSFLGFVELACTRFG